MQVAPVLSSSLRSAASVGKVRWFGDAAGGMETEGEVSWVSCVGVGCHVSAHEAAG